MTGDILSSFDYSIYIFTLYIICNSISSINTFIDLYFFNFWHFLFNVFTRNISACKTLVYTKRFQGGGGNFHYKGTCICRCATGLGYTFQASEYMNGVSFSHQKYINGVSFSSKKYMNG